MNSIVDQQKELQALKLAYDAILPSGGSNMTLIELLHAEENKRQKGMFLKWLSTRSLESQIETLKIKIFLMSLP